MPDFSLDKSFRPFRHGCVCCSFAKMKPGKQTREKKYHAAQFPSTTKLWAAHSFHCCFREPIHTESFEFVKKRVWLKSRASQTSHNRLNSQNLNMKFTSPPFSAQSTENPEECHESRDWQPGTPVKRHYQGPKARARFLSRSPKSGWHKRTRPAAKASSCHPLQLFPCCQSQRPLSRSG